MTDRQLMLAVGCLIMKEKLCETEREKLPAWTGMKQSNLTISYHHRDDVVG